MCCYFKFYFFCWCFIITKIVFTYGCYVVEDSCSEYFKWRKLKELIVLREILWLATFSSRENLFSDLSPYLISPTLKCFQKTFFLSLSDKMSQFNTFCKSCDRSKPTVFWDSEIKVGISTHRSGYRERKSYIFSEFFSKKIKTILMKLLEKWLTY